MAITREQIFEIADQLVTAGQNPTLAAVRKAVGGGSFTTISEAMGTWRSARQVATAPLREPAPPAIADRLAELGADVWAIALELASGRLQAEREALEGARVEMEAQKAEAVELADQMAAEIEQLRGRCAELDERASTEREGADEVRRQLSAVLKRAQAAEVRAGELDARAADLNKELGRVHTDLDAERKRVDINSAKADKMEQQQRAKLVSLEADRDEARKEAQLKAVENARVIGELGALKTQVQEYTDIIRGIAPTTLGTPVDPGPTRVPQHRAAGEKKTSKKLVTESEGETNHEPT